MNRQRMLICLGVVLVSGQWGLAAPHYLEAETTIASAGYLGEEGWQSSDTQGGAPPEEFYAVAVDGFLEWDSGSGWWVAEALTAAQPEEMSLFVAQESVVDAAVPGLTAGVSAGGEATMRFALDSPHRFLLQGGVQRFDLSVQTPEPPTRPDDSSLSALIELQGPSEVRRLEYELGDEAGYFPVYEYGVLAPGEYTFHAEMWDDFGYQAAPVGLYNCSSNFQLSLQLTQVPEPSGWQLLAVGAGLVCGATSWRRTSQRHRRRRHSLAMMLLFAPCGRLVAAEFQPLGDLPGGQFSSVAQAVSADGKSVVGGSMTAFGQQAFRWTQPEGMIWLEPMFSAAAVSADGDLIVGGPYRWTRAGGMETLDLLLPNGGYGSGAHGVSADGGVIVGYGFRGAERTIEAFLWTEASGTIGLGFLPGGHTSYAEGVSADGLVVVGNSSEQAYRWTAEEGMTPLGDLNGGLVQSFAVAVSADGSVIVGESDSDYLDPFEDREAFRWTESIGMVGLGYLHENPAYSSAAAVSADGRVVVGVSATLNDEEAFVWDAQHGMRSLQQLLLDAGVTNLEGWQLNRAWGISADGTVIVGSGYNPEGNTEAWRAVVPEPGSFTLAALAIAGWLFRRPLRCRHGRT